MVTNSEYPKTKSRSKPIKIARGLDEALEKFLKTEKARLMGYRYKSDVATDGIRDLLIRLGVYEEEEEPEEREEEPE